MKTQFIIIIITGFFFVGMACNSRPKVIEAEFTPSTQQTHSPDGGVSAGTHTVVCVDILHTDKYTYMEVTENDARFWIAVPRREVEKGATYTYTGGLMKTNFRSVEFDRVFETIYLVSGVTQVYAGGTAVDRALAQQQQPAASVPVNTTPAEGAVKISELFAQRTQYEGKVVSVTGRCVKINKLIMGRNWVHLDDGSISGTDLTVTTSADVPLGSTVTMTGTIALNRDFGAGYLYEVIMEGARVE